MKEQNFDTAYKEIKKLVEKFKQGEKHYLSQSYQEAEVRQDFLDDFFTALGWDVRHQIQHDPYEQEVKVERGVKVSGAQKRADYSFSIAPNFRDPKFFAEAKKPAKALKNAQDYFQSIRYGWHKAHPLSVLTDFEEFHILDCRYTPDINNSLDKCYKQFHYTDYLSKEKFAEIYFLFSREAVANNSIEKFAETLPKRKGKAAKTLSPFEGGRGMFIHQTIDEAFLEVIDGIRERLAKAFKKQDENLTSEQLTEATQRTVDRLVFIRFLEDKLIEPEHWVSEFGESPPLKGATRSAGDVSAWNDFISACRKLDAKYNGIVFKEHFIDRRNFAGADENEFRTICHDICHLNSRFLFNEIPIHILGSIYERFLGKVVHATAKRVTVEEKPEVQKAGGVYYTPKYIVDYIVHNTVGKLIEGKTPEQIAKLRFADIACGSGSFLIGVFDCLLDYHNKYYQKRPDKAKKDGCIEKDMLWVLSIKQKQKILLNNIYGVDIDQQATEVTQLSLALKLMEDETTATANDMQVLFHEKILPDMSKNIICGNSLIGMDILYSDLFSNGDTEKLLNPMNFEDVFKDVMRNGGFDAIVGNPPYVFTRDQGITECEKAYYYSKYNFQSPQLNTFSLFVERAFNVLKTNGTLGYIIPNNWLSIDSFSILRKFIIEETGHIGIINILDKVFQNANVDTCIISFDKKKNENLLIAEMQDQRISYSKIIKSSVISPPQYIFQINLLKNGNNFNLLKKIEKNSKQLQDFATVSTGVKVYQTDKGIPKQTDYEKENRIFHSTKKKNKNYKQYLEGVDVSRYYLGWSGEYLSYGDWIAEPRKSVPFDGDRILIRQIPSKLPYMVNAIFTDEAFINDINSMVVFQSNGVNLKFLLGCINSKLISFWFDKKFDKMQRKIFPQFKVKELAIFPIPKINFQNKTEKSAHDKIVSLVEQMLEAKKEIKSAKTDKDKVYYERKCSSLDKAIDTEVYTLYNITPDEINIIDGNAKK